jgi:16S rRNA (cytosine967-C5)-methyltransferase
LGSFQDGWFYVQDPSTLLAPAVLGPQPGEIILDLCAAPGGKTTLIAQRMRNQGKIVACDLDAARLKLVRDNCTRLGVGIVETKPVSTLAREPMRFDRILVDAPCSNTGVLRRRVDLRWRVQAAEIERLRAAQLDLLQQAAERLMPGGRLVYSTCSLEPEENSGVVKQFLAVQPRFQLEAERQLLPFADGVDGAYVAKLKLG